MAAKAKLRVLVVDDHDDTLDALGMMFEALGYDVRVTSRGREAVALARAFEPDLILLDIGMPDMNGYDVVMAMRADDELAHRYIVALTGHAQAGDAARAIHAGFDVHCAKPIRLEMIRQLLAEAETRATVPLARYG